MHMYAGECNVCAGLQRPEVNAMCLPQLLFKYSFTERGACQLGSTGWPASPSGVLLCFPLHGITGRQCYPQVWKTFLCGCHRIKLRPSCLHVGTLPTEPFLKAPNSDSDEEVFFLSK